MRNRLAAETSPYLQQHADNPVDWMPWGEAVFERARAEDRPILLSVGYSACHWCHVMAHESFEDPETANLMNELFLNVKVDREERPDVDAIYMSAVQAMTGHGGWPMTVFLTPDGAPFYGGTYFPPEARHGLPSFREVLTAVAEAYRGRREAVLESAGALTRSLEQGAKLRAPVGSLDVSILDSAFRGLAERYDARHGGFGGAPKFPQPLSLEFLLRTHARTGSEHALRMAVETLRRMARGGMYDQVGGGFHRYSVDAEWLVPHFEKMLYDNALLARVYVHAWQVTRDDELRRVARETLDYVLREMTSPEGGFYSAQDADSEGEEGKFYVWAPAEIDAVLEAGDADLFRRLHGVTEGGNFEGRSILHVPRDPAAVAEDAGVTEEHLRDVVERGRRALFEARSERVRPARDEKVLTSWNAMMLQALAVAGRVFDDEGYRDAAVRNAEFLLTELRPDGRLLRTWRDGRGRIEAFLEDYALLTDALLSVHEATLDPRWIREAAALGDGLLERFWDAGAGQFYDTAADGEPLVVRPRTLEDNATPSGNSAATLSLLRLAAYTGEARYREVAERVLGDLGQLLQRAPLAFGHLLGALDFHLAPPREVVIVGELGAPDTRALLEAFDSRHRPTTILAGKAPHYTEDDDLPLLAGRAPVDGKAAAYVCERFACRRPVTEPGALKRVLEAGPPTADA